MDNFHVTMMLADHVTVAEGKLYVSGGGWDVTVPGAPSAISLHVEVPWDQANRPHTLDVVLEDADGAPVMALSPEGDATPVRVSGNFEVGRPPGVREGVSLSMPFAMNVGPLPLQPGKRYVWRLLIDNVGDERWVRPFSVRPGPGQANAA